jgi:hypothetical protein
MSAVETMSAADAWSTFRRSDARRVVDLVRAVADAHDPGEHGDGVEVVVEAPASAGHDS